MKCWNCGNELNDMSFCTQCGAVAHRREPVTKEGHALRTLMDHCGLENLLNNSNYLINGLGDMLENAEPLRTNLKLAIDAGLGQLILSQLKENGAAPSAEFTSKATRLIIDKAGLSDKIAAELLDNVDDMLGWQGASEAQTAEIPSNTASVQANASAPVAVVALQQTAPVPQQAQNKLWLKVLAVIGVAIILAFHATTEQATWQYVLRKLIPNYIHIGDWPDETLLLLFCVAPPVLALAVPFLLGKGNKTEAIICAAVYTGLMLAMVGASFAFHIVLGATQLPMALFALLLLYFSINKKTPKRSEAILWMLCIIFVAIFGVLSCIEARNLFFSPSFLWRPSIWMNKSFFRIIFESGYTYVTRLNSIVLLTTFFPLHRAMLVAATALLFGAYRKKAEVPVTSRA